jgi:uncharacterized protein with FMN-binding domain
MWLMSTVTGLVLLFGYHTSTSSSAAAQGGNASVAVPVTSGTSASSGTSPGTTSSGTSSSSTSSSDTSSSDTSSSGTSSTGTGTTSSGTGSSAAATTVTGSVADTRWGPVQVQLTITNGKITAVKVLQYPNGNGRDQEINAQALPILIQETLKAQSPKIDMVSGATYTSTGYETSLQSAIDKAGM